jgi:hypothetical protein
MAALDAHHLEPEQLPTDSGLSTRRWWVESLVATAVYAVVAIVVTWPVARDLGSTVLGPSDSDSAAGIWWLDAIQEHGYRLVGATRFSQLAVPYGVEQANALNLQWLIPYFPAYLVTKVVGAVAAFNLTVLSGLALSGAAMYLLARRLGASMAVSAWSGLAFLAFPWHVERVVAGHASLVHLECLPILALTLLLYADRGSRGRLVLVGAAVAGCWLTSGYYGVMALIVVPASSVAVALVAKRRRAAFRAAAMLTGVTMGVTAVIYLASLAGAGGDPSVGITRSAEDLTRYGLRPLELVLPAPGNPILRRVDPGFWESRKHGSNIQEVSNYLGWVTIAGACLWLALAVRRRPAATRLQRSATAGAVGSFIAAFLLALPGSIEFGGARFDAMPSRLLFAAVPAFRVPTRWTVVLFLAVLILATLGLESVVRQLRLRRGIAARVGVVGLVLAASIGTWVELRVTHPGVFYNADALPPEYAVLDRLGPGATAEYPLVSSENSTNSVYLLRQRLHGRPLVNGAAQGTEAESARRALVDPAAPGVAAALAARGVTAVITRPDTYTRALELDLPEGAPRLGDGFALVGTAPDGASVWRVTAKPAPAVAFFDSTSFSTPTVDSAGRIVQELTGAAGSIVVVARRPFSGTLRVMLAAPSGARRVTVGATTTVVGERLARVDVPLRVLSGRTVVRISVGRSTVEDRVTLIATAPTVVSGLGERS